MSFLPGHRPYMPPLRPMSFDPVASTSSDPGGNTVAFNGIAIGSVPGFRETRHVVLAVTGARGSAETLVGVTMNGVAMSQIINSGGPDFATSGIYVAAAPSGTTANFVVTHTGDMALVGISVFRMINGNPVPLDTAIAGHSSGLLDLSLDVRAGGFAVACAGSANGGLTTWTGLTEVADINPGGNDETHSSAYAGPIGATASPRTVQAQCADTTPQGYRGSSASFIPA